jgi:5'-nucleotidase / UDP-sugar diphosphatase
MIRTICLVTVSAAALAAPAAAETALRILHTNDFHARFEPVSKYDSTCPADDNAAGDCFGGSARIATAIAAARDTNMPVLLLDAGDPFQGTLFFNYYQGQLAAEMMTTMGYDAMAVGNHEFDLGPEVLAAFADSADFPLVSANLRIAAGSLLEGRVAPFAVVEAGGTRVGIVGTTPTDTAELSSPGADVTFTDPVAAVQAAADALAAEGVDKVIVLSHAGLAMDRRIAEGATGIDLIVGGHSHTLLSNADERAEGPYPTVVNGVPIVHAYAYGKYLGVLDVTFDDAGKVVSASGDPVLLDASVAEDAGIKARIAEAAAPLEEIRNTVVAEAAASIVGDRAVCRAEECPMGNLVADAMLDRVADQGVTVAIQNGGGLRASIDAGPVTMGEVLTVLPFQNTLSTFQATGADLVAALENGVSQVADGAGRFPQVAGLRFTWDPAAEPGARVTGVQVQGGDGWAPIDPEATYLAVTNNFVRNGGDGYGMFAGDDRNAYDHGPDLADVTAGYLAANAPYQPYTDGRITRAD